MAGSQMLRQTKRQTHKNWQTKILPAHKIGQQDQLAGSSERKGTKRIVHSECIFIMVNMMIQQYNDIYTIHIIIEWICNYYNEKGQSRSNTLIASSLLDDGNDDDD